ncbi:bifunctional non-homologous end joining protein LigD [Rhizobiales bacterium GAS113]|nr:bifunctional non-homologous end joining protein LigD [Rhizobiales bacterium GAS113]
MKRAAAPPPFVGPQLAKLVEEPPQGKGWLFEMKFDGYRLEVAVSGKEVRIHTRSGQDWTERFPTIARAATALDLDGALIDGEVVAADERGVSDFGLLQDAIESAPEKLSYFGFDLLFDRGTDCRALPLIERKRLLRERLAKAGNGPIRYTGHVEGDGAALLAALCRQGFEGVVAKRADEPYRSGRTQSWLKIKCGHRQEFIIVGYTPSERGRPFASIAMALRERGKLRYAGRVGSGFAEKDLGELSKRFAKLARKTPPLSHELPRAIARRLRFVEPRLVAEIAFAGFTKDNLIRQGRFIGLREDKPAREIRREVAAPPPETGRGR